MTKKIIIGYMQSLVPETQGKAKYKVHYLASIDENTYNLFEMTDLSLYL